MLRYFGKYAKRVSVTEPEESDFPNRRRPDGIGGEASVDVAIGGETSVTVDNKPLSALSVHHYQYIMTGNHDYSRLLDASL